MLIQCLENIGMDRLTIEWFESFLKGWNQVVQYDNETSEPLEIHTGIIQGENNSQLLFSLFIEQIKNYVKHTIMRQFADDTQLFKKANIQEINKAIFEINIDLSSIQQFCLDVGLKLNPNKSKAIIVASKQNTKKIKYDELPEIKINNVKIEYCGKVSNLGFSFDRIFSMESHLSNVIKKVNCVLSNLYQIKSTIATSTKLQLIKALILPIIDYMDVVYDPYKSRGSVGINNKIEKLLNSCIRYIYNLKKNEHITEYKKKSGLMAAEDRRKLHTLNLIHKIINNEAPQYLNKLISINKRNERCSNKLLVRKTKNEIHKSSFTIGGPIIWNGLDETHRNMMSNKQFTTNVKSKFRSM